MVFVWLSSGQAGVGFGDGFVRDKSVRDGSVSSPPCPVSSCSNSSRIVVEGIHFSGNLWRFG